MYHEINYFLSNLNRLAKPNYNRSAITTVNASMYTQAEPLGLALIIAPFNYPIQLSLIPLVGALASGNVIMLKYSKQSKAVKDAVRKLLEDAGLLDKYVCLFNGQNDELFRNTEYNLVIFTGSTATGRRIYQNCAGSLTKCILELGGANPSVVDASAPPKHAATQLFLGKFTNAGQTCIAPNYCCFCGNQAKFEAFLHELKQ